MMLPASEVDIFSDAVLEDPWPTYRALRDLGSAVWLEPTNVCFIGRYADVRRALNDWQVFSSAQGIGFNPVINAAWDEALICQDPPVHTARRKLMMEALGPAALKPVADTIEQRASALADRIATMGTFDAVSDFALDLPVGVVMDLIGWPHDVRPALLDLASGSWNAAGPANARMEQGLSGLQEMMGLLSNLYDKERVLPGGFAAKLIASSRRGEISRETAIGMLAGYVVAAFETTISAMAAGIQLFADNPAEWDRLRTDPRLAMHAANEIVRMETPLQSFARVTTQDAELSDGSVIPAGTRVVVCYASANRDERQFEAPDSFRIDRREKQNLGFGHGPHGCAGQNLARMELTAVFGALAKRITRFECQGNGVRALNNISRSLARLPTLAVAA